MRIAFITPEFVTNEYFSGGLANYVHRVSRVLVEMGHEVHVITLAERVSVLGLTVFESEVLINLNQNPSAENIVIQGHMQFEDFFPLKTPDSNTVRLQVQIMFDLVLADAVQLF